MPVTFFVVFPFMQLTVFLSTTVVPVSKIFTIAETGEKMLVSAAFAVTEQFPALIKLRVDPVIEQIPAEVVENDITPFPEAVAVKSSILLFTPIL